MWLVDDVQMTRVTEIERLYRETGDRLWWALLAYSGDREIASDATAESFARALAASDTIRDPAAWVWKVAFRVATTELRRRRPTISAPDPIDEPDEAAVDVLAALDRLSERQRAVVVLFYLEDRPTKQISELLGIGPATVSVHLFRARRQLRAILEDDDD